MDLSVNFVMYLFLVLMDTRQVNLILLILIKQWMNVRRMTVQFMMYLQQISILPDVGCKYLSHFLEDVCEMKEALRLGRFFTDFNCNTFSTVSKERGCCFP